MIDGGVIEVGSTNPAKIGVENRNRGRFHFDEAGTAVAVGALDVATISRRLHCYSTHDEHDFLRGPYPYFLSLCIILSECFNGR